MTTQPALPIQIAMLIEARTGIDVHQKLQHVFVDMLHDMAGTDLRAFISQLEHAPITDPLWQDVIDTLTIGETYFMRESSHFELLRQRLLPPLITERRRKHQLHLSIWSAGCASGEEAYSLAILLHELLTDYDQWQIYLLGTDLNARFLALARAGVYREWSFRHTDEPFRQMYFDAIPEGWRIKPFLSERVTLRHGNLLDPMPAPKFDLILCRNVLLYFSHAGIKRAEANFHHALAEDGILLMGYAEAVRQRDLWQTELYLDTAVYGKKVRADTTLPTDIPEKPPTRLLLQSVYEQAVNALQAEQPAQAQALIGELLNAQPHNAGGHLLMAVVYADQKNPLRAHAHLDHALEYDPLLADAHYIRAMLYWEAGDIAQAGESLRAALYCQRNHPLASWMMGEYQHKIGEEARAQTHWQNARRAIKMLLPECFLCAISSMTAGQLQEILEARLRQFEAQ